MEERRRFEAAMVHLNSKEEQLYNLKTDFDVFQTETESREKFLVTGRGSDFT